jgi:hypothetical protein
LQEALDVAKSTYESVGLSQQDLQFLKGISPVSLEPTVNYRTKTTDSKALEMLGRVMLQFFTTDDTLLSLPVPTTFHIELAQGGSISSNKSVIPQSTLQRRVIEANAKSILEWSPQIALEFLLLSNCIQEAIKLCLDLGHWKNVSISFDVLKLITCRLLLYRTYILVILIS